MTRPSWGKRNKEREIDAACKAQAKSEASAEKLARLKHALRACVMYQCPVLVSVMAKRFGVDHSTVHDLVKREGLSEALTDADLSLSGAKAHPMDLYAEAIRVGTK